MSSAKLHIMKISFVIPAYNEEKVSLSLEFNIYIHVGVNNSNHRNCLIFYYVKNYLFTDYKTADIWR